MYNNNHKESHATNHDSAQENTQSLAHAHNASETHQSASQNERQEQQQTSQTRPTSHNITFTGTGSEYFKIWIVNIMLTIVTLGFYRPWAKVRTTKYFYANTHLAGRSFNFHATGKHLFLGHIIGLVLLLIAFGISAFDPMFQFGLVIVFIVIAPWIIWRSLQFNTRVTSFSNVRFGFSGTLKQSYFAYLLIPMVSIIAFVVPVVAVGILFDVDVEMLSGLFAFVMFIYYLVAYLVVFSVIKQQTITYSLANLHFGQGNFTTNLKTKEFAKLKVNTFFVGIGANIVFAICGGIIALLVGGLLSLLNSKIGFAVGFAIFYVAMVCSVIYYGCYYIINQRKYVMEQTKLDGKVTFTSFMDVTEYTKILCTNTLMIVFSLGLATPFAAIRNSKYIYEHTSVHIDEETLNSYVSEDAQQQGALSEQIGDTLDIGIDIGI